MSAGLGIVKPPDDERVSADFLNGHISRSPRPLSGGRLFFGHRHKAFANVRRDQTAAAAAATAETFVQAAINLKKEMSEDNVPLNDRWMAVPPSFVAKLENHFVTQGGSAAGIFAPATADQTIANGFGGNLVGFDLRVTTSVPTSGTGSASRNCCEFQCIGEEIAGALGTSYDTLERCCRRDFKMKFADYSAQKRFCRQGSGDTHARHYGMSRLSNDEIPRSRGWPL